jgi:hypothetical protein
MSFTKEELNSALSDIRNSMLADMKDTVNLGGSHTYTKKEYIDALAQFPARHTAWKKKAYSCFEKKHLTKEFKMKLNESTINIARSVLSGKEYEPIINGYTAPLFSLFSDDIWNCRDLWLGAYVFLKSQ